MMPEGIDELIDEEEIKANKLKVKLEARSTEVIERYMRRLGPSNKIFRQVYFRFNEPNKIKYLVAQDVLQEKRKRDAWKELDGGRVYHLLSENEEKPAKGLIKIPRTKDTPGDTRKEPTLHYAYVNGSAECSVRLSSLENVLSSRTHLGFQEVNYNTRARRTLGGGLVVQRTGIHESNELLLATTAFSKPEVQKIKKCMELYC